MRSFICLEHLFVVLIPAFPQDRSWDLASPGHPSLGSRAHQMSDISGVLTTGFSLLCCTVHKLVSPTFPKLLSTSYRDNKYSLKGKEFKYALLNVHMTVGLLCAETIMTLKNRSKNERILLLQANICFKIYFYF